MVSTEKGKSTEVILTEMTMKTMLAERKMLVKMISDCHRTQTTMMPVERKMLVKMISDRHRTETTMIPVETTTKIEVVRTVPMELISACHCPSVLPSVVAVCYCCRRSNPLHSLCRPATNSTSHMVSFRHPTRVL